jgi:eukaryotic-like serine/threonine-protein kinase
MYMGETPLSHRPSLRPLRRICDASSGMTANAIGSLCAGSALGRYELLLPIAQGGMATVWAARMKGSRGFSKIVAIKTMLPSLSSDPRFEQMFLSEAEIASRIKHPNVCEILDLGEQDGVLYLAMDWIDGDSLVTLLAECQRQDRKLPYGVAARIGTAAARGLHAAHELKDDAGALFGIVHRDVSPHNILVTFDGLVKIVDFGVAKAVARSDHQVTHAGHLKGKTQYMAPEQAFCDEVDRRTDVFALGIVLYQITTGTHPFRADNELATLARITSPEPVPSPETLAPDYPPELSAVVLKALAKEPSLRYATMNELARDLETVATKLSGPDSPGLDAFVGEALRERASEQRATLREALRAADDRSLAGGVVLPRERLALSSAGMALPKELAAMSSSAGRGHRIALAAGLVALGAVLGAAGLVWVTGSASAPASSAGPAPSLMLSSGAPVRAPSVALSAEAPSATSATATTAAASATAAAASATAAAASATAVPKASASSAGPATGRPPVQDRPGPPKVDPRAKLRKPDF